MTNITQDSPFTPGGGHIPPLLAGRETETALLAEALDRLQGPRAADGSPLAGTPLPPIRLCGPRGGGKTALLGWMKQRAEDCGIIKQGLSHLRQQPDGVQQLLEPAIIMADELEYSRPELHSQIVARDTAFASEIKQGRQVFDALVRAIVAKEPLLLTLDEVHSHDLIPLRELLRTCEKIIAEGYPLAVVMAGPPALDRQLYKADPDFLGRSKGLYLNLLSDEAARDAMRVPLEWAGFAVQPDALETMAARAENYPYFVQLIGEEVWKAATEAGVKEIDAKLVAQVAEKLRGFQKKFHIEHCDRLEGDGLMRHALAAMKLLERRDGVASVKDILAVLADSSEEDGGDPAQIHAELQENGLIWTVDGETRAGHPALYDRFKERYWRFAGEGSLH